MLNNAGAPQCHGELERTAYVRAGCFRVIWECTLLSQSEDLELPREVPHGLRFLAVQVVVGVGRGVSGMA